MALPDFQLLHVDRGGKILAGLGTIYSATAGPSPDDMRALQHGMANVPGSRIERRPVAKPNVPAAPLAAAPVAAPRKPAAPAQVRNVAPAANDQPKEGSVEATLELARQIGLKGFADKPDAAQSETVDSLEGKGVIAKQEAPDTSTPEGLKAFAKAIGLKGFA